MAVDSKEPEGDLVTDWFRVIVDLERSGYKHATIALSVDAPRTTLLGWKQGAEPKHRHGERLIALWCRVEGRGRDLLPTISTFDWRR